MPFHLRPRYFGGSPTAPGARITPVFEGWTRGNGVLLRCGRKAWPAVRRAVRSREQEPAECQAQAHPPALRSL